MIHLVQQPATDAQVKDMLEQHESYIKLAVDVKRSVLAGGGEFHADCEAVLVEDGSARQDVWGADWVPDQQTVRYSSLINIRPKMNASMEILDPAIRQQVERVVRTRFKRA